MAKMEGPQRKITRHTQKQNLACVTCHTCVADKPMTVVWNPDSGLDTPVNVTVKLGVRYSSVGSEEVSCFATYHFHTCSRPTMAKRFSE